MKTRWSKARCIEAIRLVAVAAFVPARASGAPVYTPCPAEHPVLTAPMSGRYTDPARAGGWLGWLEDETRAWIGFVSPNGHGLVWTARDAEGNPIGEPLSFHRDPKVLREARAWARDIGPDAVHVDGPMKVVRHGVEFTVDRPIGYVKRGVAEDGSLYETTYSCAYGFIAGTLGGDGHEIDAYLGEHTGGRDIFVIDQIKSDGTPDEQKVMVGQKTMADAIAVYDAHTPHKLLAACWQTTVRDFKAQLKRAMKDPEKPYLFTHAASPVTAAPAVEPDEDDEERIGPTGRPDVAPVVPPPAPAAPAAPPAIIGAGAPSIWVRQSPAELQRLLDAPVELSPAEAFLCRAAPVVAGTARATDREIDLCASDESVDSYGTILRAKWDLRRFVGKTANPVLLWAHNRRQDLPPVGTVPRIGVDEKVKALMATARFDAGPDASEFDRLVWAKYLNGVMRAFSVGFNPKSARIEVIDGEEILVFPESELTELSCVPVPSNVGALALDARQRAMTLVRGAGGRIDLAEGLSAALDHLYRASSRAFVPNTLPVAAPAPVAPATRAEEGAPPVPPGGSMMCVNCATANAPGAATCTKCAVVFDKAAMTECARCKCWSGVAREMCAFCGAELPKSILTPVTRDASAPLALAHMPWDAAEAMKALRAFATGAAGAVDLATYGRAFAWAAPEPKGVEDFQVPLCAVRGDAMVVVRGALSEAVGIVNGTRPSTIPAADMPAVRARIEHHHTTFGLPSPWAATTTNTPQGPGERSMKKLSKDQIRVVGDGAVVIACCPGCKDEIEVTTGDLPPTPELTRSIATLTAEKTTLAAEKTAEATRADRLAGENTRVYGVVAKMADQSLVRDLTERAGKKFDPADLESELDLARSYLNLQPRLVPVDAAKPDGDHEIEGMRAFRSRLEKLDKRADIGMLGPSASRQNPGAPRTGAVTAATVAGAPVVPAPGAPPVRAEGGVQLTTVGGQSASTGGDALAKRMADAAAAEGRQGR